MMATAALGSLFLLLKGFEWYVDIQEHMAPFLNQPFELADDRQSTLFVNLYWVTTGLHGFHLITGVTILMILALQARAEGYLSAPPEPDRGLRPLLALHRPDLDHGVPRPLRDREMSMFDLDLDDDQKNDVKARMRVPAISFAVLMALLAINVLLGATIPFREGMDSGDRGAGHHGGRGACCSRWRSSRNRR